MRHPAAALRGRRGFLLAAASLGWGKDSSGLSPTDLEGNLADDECEYISTTGLGTVDLIASGGQGTVVFNANHTFQATVTEVGGETSTFSGSWEIDGIDLLRVTPTGASWYWAFDMTLSSNSVKLRNGGGEYDFNHDGTDDQATWNMDLVR